MSEKILGILGVTGFAERYGLKIGTVYSHLSRKTDLPPYFKIGSKTFWRLADVEAWELEQLKARRKKNFED